ncbi:BlaI/MecI/CopY family transcriptional regulator [Chryseobacterium sp. SNU WT5]|uniref:BlaI/MecI/CopY family transcriptional regulator n=1 Tax=Chryseobacterium sp. SNU WT5 TaxID=2594269 RepID=UPI00117CDCE6|nr:BlaI/MecI/CopY family transcriptional regulator [Chryseobacterium sp. SNU WT5]QDP84084.1 BlaI/MecI/CopY family transcriptional regulator [Chryseobacterium sp. SNU WT5]
MKIDHLTTAEEQLMKVLWDLNSGYMRNIIEAYPEPKPHANTISTFLKILVEKEFLTTTKEGRIFKYEVAIPIDEYRNYLLRNLINDYYDGSVENFNTSLRSQNLILTSNVESESELKQTTTDDIILTDFINEITGTKKKKKKKKKNKLKSMDEVKINVKKKK